MLISGPELTSTRLIHLISLNVALFVLLTISNSLTVWSTLGYCVCSSVCITESAQMNSSNRYYRHVSTIALSLHFSPIPTFLMVGILKPCTHHVPSFLVSGGCGMGFLLKCFLCALNLNNTSGVVVLLQISTDDDNHLPSNGLSYFRYKKYIIETVPGKSSTCFTCIKSLKGEHGDFGSV